VYVDDAQARSYRGCSLAILGYGVLVLFLGVIIGTRADGRLWILAAALVALAFSAHVRRVPEREASPQQVLPPEPVVVEDIWMWRKFWSVIAPRTSAMLFVLGPVGRRRLTPLTRWAIERSMLGRSATAYHLSARRTVLVFDEHTVLWCWRATDQP
jgi:hypothetical protein